MGAGLFAVFFTFLSGFFNRWQSLHSTFIARHLGLQPLSGRVCIAAACVFVLGAAAVNYDIRERQYAAWKSYPAITHLGDMPLFSTADGLFDLVYDDYLQVRIFRLSNRASVN